MSYQAITDIIVNPSQIQDLQLSNTVKDSPKQSSASFADFLASYKADEDKDISASAPVKEPEKAENTEKTAENQVKNDKEPEKPAEKAVEKTDSEEKVDEKLSEKSDSKSKNVKTSDSEIKNPSDEKKTAKADVREAKDSKNKKLSDKDFSRLDEVTKGAENSENADKLAAAVQNSVKSDESKDVKLQKDDSENTELAIDTDAKAQVSIENLKTENEASDSDFKFDQNQNKDKKQLTLDKDGKITVEDQRTKEVAQTEDKKPVIKASEIKLTNENTAVMSVELNPNAEADVLSLNTQTAAADGSNFQAMLSNQLHNVAPEFVKAGNLILKDNNQGTINLVLHPDDLGNVKIHLSLDGKTLSGHITVATKEALQVFKDNAETLREAFIKNGFDTANFDVAMNNGGSFNQNMGFQGQDDGRTLAARRLYGDSAEGLSAELDDIFDNTEDISNYSVNIVA